MTNSPTFLFFKLSIISTNFFIESISKPESISSKIHNSASIVISCNNSFLFFSPPENPSFIFRLKNEISNPTVLIFFCNKIIKI